MFTRKKYVLCLKTEPVSLLLLLHSNSKYKLSILFIYSKINSVREVQTLVLERVSHCSVNIEFLIFVESIIIIKPIIDIDR